MVDGWTPEQGYTISSPCEQGSSCELIIGGKDPPKLIEITLGRNDQVRNDPDRNDPFTGACNHRIGPERTGSEVITGSDLIFQWYMNFM